MDLELLDSTLAELGEPAYRAKQAWQWAAGGAAGYGEMTNLPQPLRDALDRSVPYSSLTVERDVTARDGTVKALFVTADNRPSRPCS